MDLVSLLAILVFSVSWYLYSQTDEAEATIRLFFRSMMMIGAAIGALGFVVRLTT
ncbi:MAG: hypothetical protein ACXWVS_12035 [Hyphomicrobium sp.]